MSAPTASRFKRYFTVILRWFLIVAVVFVLTLFSGVYITDNILPKVYTSTAQIQVSLRGVGPLGGDPGFDSTNFQAELETMESPNVLLSVIKYLGLDKTWAKRVYAADSDELPDVDALTHMRNILKIDLIRGTNIIKITASSDAPKEAADIANAIVDQYKTIRDGEENQRLGQGLTESSVRVLTRAEIPEVPTKPNRRFNFIVTILAACFLSITVASFNEVILLLSRASERTDN